MDKTPAILIGRQRLTETSLIVSWCAPEVGLFKTVAKGALRPKSAFSGKLDLFISADIRFIRSKSSDLHNLAEAEWTNPRLSLRESYGRVLAATYLIKLLELMVERETPIPALFELLTKALDHLATHDPTLAILERYELRLAEDLGLGNGENRKPALALQMAVHKSLPVQRRQVIEWINAHAVKS